MPTMGKVDSYGFERPEDFDEKAYEEFMSTYLMVLARRASRWMPVVVGKEHVPKSAKIKRFCRKGIPGEHRPLVWMEVSGAGDRMRESPGLYKQLLSQKLDAAVAESIRLDIHRTFPENIYFADIRDPAGLQKPLKNVLTAFALHNPHIAYCQGLNFIAGMMLLILRNEEKAFWLLDTLTRTLLPDTRKAALLLEKRYPVTKLSTGDPLTGDHPSHATTFAQSLGWSPVRDFYASDMVAVKAEQELLGDMIKWKMPELYHHLDELGLHWSLVGMKWFICLYADVLPVETVLRIWDAMFYEGSKVLLRVALTLVKFNKDKLMKTTNFANAVDIFKVMVNEASVLNCHKFMESIFKETGSMPGARIARMREECTKRVVDQ